MPVCDWSEDILERELEWAKNAKERLMYMA